jgi:hypothetical protein
LNVRTTSCLAPTLQRDPAYGIRRECGGAPVRIVLKRLDEVVIAGLQAALDKVVRHFGSDCGCIDPARSPREDRRQMVLQPERRSVKSHE